MRKVFNALTLITIISLFSLSSGLFAQEQDYTAKQALKIFNSGNYIEAELAYGSLLDKFPRDPNYNFYMGICELTNKSDISGAIKKLNYARVKKVSRNVYYYLGKAHRANYEFDEAIRNFSTYVKFGSPKDKRIAEAKTLIAECKRAQSLSSKIFQLTVLERNVSHRDRLLDYYYPAQDVGKIMKNSAFFDSGVNEDGTLFITERKDVVYYTSSVSEEDSSGIYKMEKLIDGWGASSILEAPVNSSFNDAYPFLETDGVTLYFASDRPGGFGGYDIYKTYFDVETQSYVEPINLGVPFNSSEDDFLFVADEFNGIAWFASNRETNGDQVMVYAVEWDGTQVRNMAENSNQIKEAGQLRISSNDEADEYESNFTFSDKKKRTSLKNDFEFSVNDTIIYYRYDDFLQAEALKLFRIAFEKQKQKDALSKVMQSKRKDYALAKSPEEQNNLVNQILKLETQVYSLEDEINEGYVKVRYLELQEIKKQQQEGTYVPNNYNDETIDNSLVIPAKYKYLVADEFDNQDPQLKEMYLTAFSSSDVEELELADSLYVWANLLNLESSNILEKSTKVEPNTSISIANVLKNDAANAEPSESTSLINESKDLKELSAKLYHKSLDKKYPIYWIKLNDLYSSGAYSQESTVADMAGRANVYYKEGNDMLTTVGGVTMEEYEKSGSLKRKAIELQEKALIEYVATNANNKENNSVVGKTGVVQKSYSELHKGDDQSTSVSADVESPSKLQDEYRVQIGVFRNAPNPNSLANIPPTSTIEIESKGLTKYMSGHFKTKAEAEKAIPLIEAAGFKGAYVVFVKEGKYVSKP